MADRKFGAGYRSAVRTVFQSEILARCSDYTPDICRSCVFRSGDCSQSYIALVRTVFHDIRYGQSRSRVSRHGDPGKDTAQEDHTLIGGSHRYIDGILAVFYRDRAGSRQMDTAVDAAHTCHCRGLDVEFPAVRTVRYFLL